MPKTLQAQRSLAAAAALAAGLAFSTTVLAADDNDVDPQTALEDLTVEVKKLDVADVDNVATEHLGRADALIDRARTLQAKGEMEAPMTRTLEELEGRVAVIEALLAYHAAAAENAAAAEEKERVETALAEARDGADAKERELAELEKKMGGSK